MEPSQTPDATLPQQHLTHAAGGCPSELRSEDLMLGGHEGANPHVGPRVASKSVNNAGIDILQPPGVIAQTLEEAEGSSTKIITRLDVFHLMKGKKNLPLSERVNLVVNSIGANYQISHTEDEIKANLPSLLSKCEKKYNKCKNITYFVKKHGKWLSETFVSGYILAPPKHSDALVKSQQIHIRERLDSIHESEPLQKRLKSFASIVKQDSQHTSACVIESCLKPKDPITEIAEENATTTKPYTEDEALALLIKINMTVDTYIFLQTDLLERGFPAYPPYDKLLEAKQKCYPNLVQITQSEASVPLQSLLQHTFGRIVYLQDEVFSQYCNKKEINNLDCVFEGVWGFDSSSDQPVYINEDERYIFIITFVPQRIFHRNSRAERVLLWTNSAPLSYRSCRPLRVTFKRESKELIICEKESVEQEINNLTPIHHKLSSGQHINAAIKLDLAMSIVEYIPFDENWRSVREHHMRKLNYKHTMEDLFRRALVASDPIITAEIQLLEERLEEFTDKIDDHDEVMRAANDDNLSQL